MNEMKIRMTVEFELDDNFFGDIEEDIMWLENKILVGDRNLLLHSNEIGDTLGEITKVSNITINNKNRPTV